jgi:hypothetical protein
LVVAKVKERLAVGKRMVKKMDVERFNVKQLHEEEVKEQYQVTNKNKFADLENLDDNGDINKAWETIKLGPDQTTPPQKEPINSAANIQSK